MLSLVSTAVKLNGMGARVCMTDRRSLLKMMGAAALLGIAGRASAQNARSFTIAYLALLPNEDRTFVPNFLHRLDQLGYVDGHNLHFVYRSAEGRPELLPGLASDLVRMKPDVLVTGFGTLAAKVGKAAGDGIPVVFMAVGDPVGAGIVASLARPGGNVTGLSDLAAGLQGNRLQLLCEMVPAASLIAAVFNPGTPYAALAYKELEAAAHIAKVETPGLRGTRAGGYRPAARGQQGRGSRWPRDLRGPLHLKSTERDCRTRLPAASARYLRLPRVRGGRRPYVLRNRPCRTMAARRGDR